MELWAAGFSGGMLMGVILGLFAGWRLRGIDGLLDLVDARVHRLATVHDLVDIQSLEDFREAVAQRHGDDAVFLLFVLYGRLRRGLLGHALAVLLKHVVDFDGIQLAQLQRHLQRLARVVRVHMHLHDRQVGNDQHAVADAFQTLAQTGHVGVFDVRTGMGDDEFRTIAEGDFLQRLVVVHKIAGQRRAGRFGKALNRRAGEGGEEAGVDDHQAFAAGIYHAGLLQNGQHVRRAL